MKRIACQFTYPTTIAVAAAVLFAFIVLAGASPSHAAGATTAGTCLLYTSDAADE